MGNLNGKRGGIVFKRNEDLPPPRKLSSDKSAGAKQRVFFGRKKIKLASWARVTWGQGEGGVGLGWTKDGAGAFGAVTESARPKALKVRPFLWSNHSNFPHFSSSSSFSFDPVESQRSTCPIGIVKDHLAQQRVDVDGHVRDVHHDFSSTGTGGRAQNRSG